MKLTIALLITAAVAAITPATNTVKTLRGQYCLQQKPGCTSYLSFENDTKGMLLDYEKGNLWPFNYTIDKKGNLTIYHNLDTTLIGKYKLVNDSTIILGKTVYKRTI